MNWFPLTFLLLVASSGAGLAAVSPDQTGALEAARAYALDYIRKLPNFICTQTTYREDAEFSFRTALTTDVIEERVTFVNQRESYEVVQINRKKVTGVQHMELPGAISSGEFGSLLHAVFDPLSHAAFTWERTARLRGRDVYVFGFHIPKETGIPMFYKKSRQAIIAPYSGSIFMDVDTKEILRINIHVDLPATFPIQDADESVEYKPIAIAGKDFMLPFHSEVRMSYDRHRFTNRIDFKAYHKFSTKVTMHVDDAADEPPATSNRAPAH